MTWRVRRQDFVGSRYNANACAWMRIYHYVKGTGATWQSLTALTKVIDRSGIWMVYGWLCRTLCQRPPTSQQNSFVYPFLTGINVAAKSSPEYRQTPSVTRYRSSKSKPSPEAKIWRRTTSELRPSTYSVPRSSADDCYGLHSKNLDATPDRSLVEIDSNFLYKGRT